MKNIKKIISMFLVVLMIISIIPINALADDEACENHIFGDWIIEYNPTCTLDGSQYRICETCGLIEKAAIQSKGHDCTWVTTIVPTNNLNGERKFICDVCGKIEKTESIPTVPLGYIGVYDAETLYNVRNDLDGEYFQLCDIDISKETAPGGKYSHNITAGWLPIGSTEDYSFKNYHDNYFTGTYDGNFHTINGMRISIMVGNASISEKVAYIGLFSYVSGDINNLVLDNVDIEINYSTSVKFYVGAVAGGHINGDGAVDAFDALQLDLIIHNAI